MPSSTFELDWRNSASSWEMAENSEIGRARAVICGTVHESADGCAPDRNGDDEHRALRRVGGNAHGAVVAVDQAAHDRQPEPSAARFACRAGVDLVKGVEHPA